MSIILKLPQLRQSYVLLTYCISLIHEYFPRYLMNARIWVQNEGGYKVRTGSIEITILLCSNVCYASSSFSSNECEICT